jgi:dihydrofolate reductase
MRDLVVHEFISLDGVIQAPGAKDEDTDGGFEHGGWTLPYWDDAIGAHFGQAFAKADALLLGRRTWQEHGEAFEAGAGKDEFADTMNAIQKYVVSTTLSDASMWRNSTLIGGDDVVGAVRALKAQDGGDILLDGSSVLAHTLEDADLIDQYDLHVYPIVLGGGKRLFRDGMRHDFRLVEAVPVPSGVVLLRYRKG